jgi:hypothetical protein
MQPHAHRQQQQEQAQPRGQSLSANGHHESGDALRKQGDFEGAVRQYTAALTVDPAHFHSLFNRAFSLDKVCAGCLGSAGFAELVLTRLTSCQISP